jgi:hypothetical protein
VPFDWEPTAEDLAKLGPVGRQFVAASLRKHEHNFVSGSVLLAAASEMDLLEIIRERIREQGIVIKGRGGAMKPNPLIGHSLRASRHLFRLLRWLKVDG